MSQLNHFHALLAAVFLAAACSSPQKESVPIYVWQNVSYQTSSDTLMQHFVDWKRHGVTGVCISARDLDQIREASAMAHAVGLEYHAWTPSMLRSGLPHEWYAINRLGESSDVHPNYVDSYRFLDPANPEVQDYLLEQYTTIAQIPDVDYVCLDFIRYPDVILANALIKSYGLNSMNGEYAPADYCYCDNCVETFKQQMGIDIREVEDPSTVVQWAQFRCDQITLFVDKVVNAVHNLGKKVSVDVFPGPSSYAEHMVRQQWNQWMADMFFPMNYNTYYEEGPEWLSSVVEEEVESAGKDPIISSLRLASDPHRVDANLQPDYTGLLPSELGIAIHNSLSNGASGICLFNGNRITAEYWSALEEAIKAESDYRRKTKG